MLVTVSSLLSAASVPALLVALRAGAAATAIFPLLARAGGNLVNLAPPPILLLTLIAVLLVTIAWSTFLRRRIAEKAEQLRLELAVRARAEQALRESEEKYRVVVENANEAVVVVQEGRLVFVNRMASTTLGYPRAEMDGMLLTSLIHPDDRGEALSRHRKRLVGEPVEDPHEIRIVDARGRTLWAELSGAIISWQGKPAVLNFVTDITERRNAAESARVQGELCSALSGPLALDEGVRLCLDAAAALSGLDAGGVYLLSGDTGALELEGHFGLSEGFVQHASRYDAAAPETKAVLAGDPIYARYEDITGPDDEANENEGLKALAVVPIKYEGRVIGCMNMSSHTLETIPPEARGTLEAVATRVGGAIAAKRAERGVRENRRFLQSVFDSISDGITVLDCDHNVLRVNAWVEELYANKGQLTGRKCYQVFMDRTAPCPWCPCVRAIQSGDRRTEVMPYPTASRASRWMEISAFPLKDESGRVVAVIKHMRDITTRRQADKVQSVLFQVSQAVHASGGLTELLEAIHYQLGRLINTTNFYVALYDEETDMYSFPYLVDEYKEEFTIPPQQGLKKSLTDYVRRTGKAILVDEQMHQRLEAAGEVELIGRPSPVWLGVPLRTAQKVIGVVVVQSYDDPALYSAKDLELLSFVAENIAVGIERKWGEDEREKLEAQVQHAQKLESLGVLAGGIAHDFNNLLTGILGNADLTLMSLPDGSSSYQSVREIKKTAERAADLSRQMLAYSGRGSFLIETIDLNDVVREMGHLLEASISKRAVLTYEVAADLPPVVADTTQIRQVIMNLITNASDALGDADGLIRIRTGVKHCDRAYLGETYLDDQLPEGEYVYLEVEDTGCGMDEATLQKIFDPFFTTKFTGRGLGLAAALGIIRGHRGAVEVKSEAGKGTLFRVFFPMSDQPLKRAAPQAPVRETRRAGGTVLLVDDEQAIRDVAGRMLEQAGFTVLRASDGNEAVSLFGDRKDEIGCVLLDLTMPRKGGEETFKELKGIRPDVRVVVSSGYSEQEVAQRFAGEDVAGFVQKPYLYATLVSMVSDAMGKADGQAGGPAAQ
jgi:PAS domain S-box-containing protein